MVPSVENMTVAFKDAYGREVIPNKDVYVPVYIIFLLGANNILAISRMSYFVEVADGVDLFSVINYSTLMKSR